MSGDRLAPLAPAYAVGGATVLGAQHARRGLPNQDAIAWWQAANGALPIVLAVSDGHGGAAYFRSDAGARAAVEAAVAKGRELAQGAADQDLSAVKREAEERLPQLIVRDWTERVRKHLADNPIRDEERERLAGTAGERACARLAQDPFSAYGATLLFVIASETFIVCGQLGDGDLLWVDESANASMLFAAPADQVGEETASLCMKDAWRSLQVKVAAIHERHPPLLLASTDGYSKSFLNDGEFLRIGGDYLRIVRERGVEALEQGLPSYLSDATAHGSGDDITLGFIRCGEVGDPDSRARQAEAELAARFEAKADRADVEQLHASLTAAGEQARVAAALAPRLAELQSQVGQLTAKLWRLNANLYWGAASVLLVVVLLSWWARSH